ncbi:MAG: YitT family protein [Clostridiales bacterium]|nr:YitT family protein [Clostridiales bacterium]
MRAGRVESMQADEKTEKRKKRAWAYVIKYAIITLGGIVYALGVSLFLDPNNVAAGGVTGISIVLHHLLAPYVPWLDTAVLIVLINVPLFILGAVFFGKGFVLSTMYATLSSSLFIELFKHTVLPHIPMIDRLVAAIIGGVLFGLGMGLIFKMGSTTGGTDIIIKLLRKKFRYIRIGFISVTLDFTIVCISTIVFRDFELACYTLISIAIFSFVFDMVIYGGNSAKMIYIIADNEKSPLICEKLLHELDLGATYLDGEGAYSGDKRRIIMCVAKSMTYPRLRDVVKEIDPHAFMIVSSAKEIYGEGYKDHNTEEI